MTGEMYQIDPVTGEEPDGTIWPLHAAVAKAVGGKVMPFDQYQGPYVAVGQAKLWIELDKPSCPACGRYYDSSSVRVWREDTDTLSDPFYPYREGAEACAAEAAVLLMVRAREGR